MTNIRGLLESTGATAGFIGGEPVDHVPYMTLTEAASRLPCIVIESQVAVGRQLRRESKAMNESTGIILESAIDSLKDKIDAFFERIGKWIRSIIAKLKVQIDRIRLSGEDLFARYANRLGTDADYRDMTFEGYRFVAGSKIVFSLKDSYDADIEGLIKKGLQLAGAHRVQLPHDFGMAVKRLARRTPEGQILDQDKATEIMEDIDEITDLTQGERTSAMASAMVGRTLTEGWEDDLRRKIWGEKGPIRYGTDMFTPKIIGQVLRDKSLATVMEGYQKLDRAIKDYRNRLKGELHGVYDEYEQKTNVMNFPGNLNALAIITRYYNAYIAVVRDALTANTRIKALKVDFHTEMYHQAVTMLIRMVNKHSTGINDNYTGPTDLDIE